MDKLPEDLFREWWLNNSEVGLTYFGIGFYAFASGFNVGRKAEREWLGWMVLQGLFAHSHNSYQNLISEPADSFPKSASDMAEAISRAWNR